MNEFRQIVLKLEKGKPISHEKTIEKTQNKNKQSRAKSAKKIKKTGYDKEDYRNFNIG